MKNKKSSKRTINATLLEEALKLPEGPEKTFKVFNSLKHKKGIPVVKIIGSLPEVQPEGKLKERIDACSFVALDGLLKQPIPCVKKVFTTIGVEMSRIYSMSWIGHERVEFIIQSDYFKKFTSTINHSGFGFKIVKNFNSLEPFTYRRNMGTEEEAREFSINNYIKRAAHTAIRSDNIAVTAKYLSVMPLNARQAFRAKIQEISGIKPWSIKTSTSTTKQKSNDINVE